MNKLKVIMKTLPIREDIIVTRNVPSLKNLISMRYDENQVYMFFMKTEGEPIYTKEFLFAKTNKNIEEIELGYVVPLITIFEEKEPERSLHLFGLIRTEDEEAIQDDLESGESGTENDWI